MNIIFTFYQLVGPLQGLFRCVCVYVCVCACVPLLQQKKKPSSFFLSRRSPAKDTSGVCACYAKKKHFTKLVCLLQCAREYARVCVVWVGVHVCGCCCGTNLLLECSIIKALLTACNFLFLCVLLLWNCLLFFSELPLKALFLYWCLFGTNV
jgi:hypothetical protein